MQVAPEPSTVEMLRDLVSTLDNLFSLPQLGRLPVHHHLCESLLGDRNTLQLTRPCVCPQLQGHQTSCITLSWYILFSLYMILFVFLWSSCWRQPHHLFSPPQCLTSSTLQLSYPSWQWGLLCCQKIFVVSSWGRFSSAMQGNGSPFSETTCHFYPVIYYTVQVIFTMGWEEYFSPSLGSLSFFIDSGDIEQGSHALPSNQGWKGKIIFKIYMLEYLSPFDHKKNHFIIHKGTNRKL